MTPTLDYKENFYVRGRDLYDTADQPVILRGINKMFVWDGDDPDGAISFPEIRKTGANSVRIVWAITTDLEPGGPATSPATLDALIANAKGNELVPMIELHDATGRWDRLDDLVEYWTRPEIVSIIQKHRKYLLLNIGNEVGDDGVTDGEFTVGYTNAIRSIRGAQIHSPLIIDAPDWGKSLSTLNNTASTLLDADPEKNVIFSVHLYWSMSRGADADHIRAQLQNAVDAGYPLIVGEFSRYGGYPLNEGESICGAGGEIDYRTILEECHKHGIGWYAWEWGPGNDFNDPLCSVMDMTPDRMFANLKPGWAQEVAVSSPYGIKNTSLVPSTR